MSRTTTRLALSVALLLPFVAAGVATAGPSGGALPPVLIEQLQVADRYGIPADAEMVAANITAVDPAEPGYLTVFPCDEDVPATSNVNYLAGEVAPNLVLSRISDNGTICVATLAVSDIIVDIVGYVPVGSGITPLPNPLRFIDTREDGPEPVRAGSTLQVTIADLNGVPADADVVMANVTAVALGQPGHLTAYPCGEALPETSSVNFAPNQVVPNMVTSRIGANGAVCIHTIADVEIIVDVAAYSDAGVEPLANPVRVVDTRDLDTPVAAGGVLTVDIAGRDDVPDDATAAVYNLTAVTPAAPGFATSYPCDISLPLVSNLNYAAGQVVANGTITKLSDAGELCVYTLAESHIIVDLVGYTEGATDYVPVTPIRIWDTREGWQRTCDWLIIAETAGTNTDAVRVFNAITGEVRTLPLGFTPPTRAADITINAECDGVLVLITEASSAITGVHELAFSGGATRTRLPAALEFSFLGSVHSTGGVLVGDEGGALFDAATGDQVWEGPFSSDPVDSIDVSENGIAALSYSNFETGAVTKFEIWDIVSSNLLFRDDLPEGSNRLSISPDGTYAAIGISSDSATGRPAQIAVVTLFGDVVDIFSVPVDVRAFFVGPGALLMCADFNGTYEWDLFGALTQVLTWPQVTTALGRDFCGLSR